MFIVLVSYRSRGNQTFRREQLIKMLDNTHAYFKNNGLECKIVVAEQYNNNKFNRGFLLNVAFLESKVFQCKKYFHMNVDYYFDLTKKIPEELLNVEGFIELFKPPYPVLGSACVFDSDSYELINGFPNDLEGWGGDDWAIYNRIKTKQIKLLETPNYICNSGIITEINNQFCVDQSNNEKIIRLSFRPDIDTNGINSIHYKIDGHGEFHNGNDVIHLLIN